LIVITPIELMMTAAIAAITQPHELIEPFYAKRLIDERRRLMARFPRWLPFSRRLRHIVRHADTPH